MIGGVVASATDASLAISGNDVDWPAWPDYALVSDLLPTLTDWHAQGRRVALATLVDIRGSAPRPLGSEMAIADDGGVAGYVSGGCVEAAVACEALSALRDGRARQLRYGEGSGLFDIQLECGGGIGVLVRPLPDLGEYVQRWQQSRIARRPFKLAIDRQTARQRYLDARALPDAGEWLVVHPMPMRLHLVGGDPAILALVELAPQFGIEVRVLRPDGPPTPPNGLSPRHYDHRALTAALADLELDPRSALYSLSHDADIDLQVVRTGLASNTAVIGVLGSRRKRDARLAELYTLGYSKLDLQRLRMPAGIRMGRSSPQDIALGILAEVAGLPVDGQTHL